MAVTWRAALDVVTPLLVGAALVVAPAVPRAHWGALEPAVAPWFDALKRLSFSQSWRMYSPDANRSYTEAVVWATQKDGARVLLQGDPEAAPPGSVFFWNRTRRDFWGYRAVHTRPDRPHAHRLWWLRARCVDAARQGLDLREVELERVRWRVTPPAKVVAGAPPLRPPTRKNYKPVRCAVGVVRTMIQSDEERRRAD